MKRERRPGPTGAPDRDRFARGFTRRGLLRGGASSLGLLGSSFALPRTAQASPADGFGPLLPPDANGLRLPAGFSSRIVAEGNAVPLPGSSYTWHRAPDGGACFAAPGGGWVYVSNSELPSGAGGVGALRFDATGELVDAYSILSGTKWNCAGGPTPWNTWLSCEEDSGSGHVYECDPFAPGQGVMRPALGTFTHEAAAVDPGNGYVYLTEDRTDGLLYRFVPSIQGTLATGVLECAEIDGEAPISEGELRAVTWHAVPEPNVTPTRTQVPEATPFDGGEGCFWHQRRLYFTTKGNGRVWELDTSAQQIRIIYDQSTSPTPHLTSVDNVFVTPAGDVLVAEDGGDLQLVALTPTGNVVPILQGPDPSGGSELAGPALSPDGTRLYLSSQRGITQAGEPDGVTFEVTGPFTELAIPTLGLGLGGLIGAALAAAGGLWLLERRRRDPVL